MAEESLATDTSARTLWEEAARKALRGASLDSLVTRALDGFDVKALYTRDDETDSDVDARVGPGKSRRGLLRASGSAASPTGRAWEVRQTYDASEPGANSLILKGLESGVTAVSLASTGEVSDLDAVLQDVRLDLAPVNLTPGTDARGAAALTALWSQRGFSFGEVAGCLGSDHIARLAATGSLASSLGDELGAATATAASTADQYSNVATFDVDGTVFAFAGATDAYEIAALLAGGARYLGAMVTSGMTIQAAARQLRFTMSIGPDQFAGIAKIRAARQCWARIVQVFGGSETDRAMYIHAVTSPSMLTRRDPWLNAVRCTTACFAAATAGADAITVGVYDSALGTESELGLRIARNTQSILSEESGIGAVIDPAGGSWYVEELTSLMARRAWSQFQEIEAGGGIGAALVDGSVQRKIAETVQQRRNRLNEGIDEIVGVTIFAESDGESLETPSPQLANRPTPDAAVTCDPLVPIRWSDLVDSTLETQGAHGGHQ